MGKIEKNKSAKKKDVNLQLPEVDWLEKESNPEKFFKDLRYALSEFGFMVLQMPQVSAMNFSNKRLEK